MQRKLNPFNEIAQQGIKRQQQSEEDISIWEVEDADGHRKDIYVVDKDVQLRGDNQMPMIVARRTFKLDDTGRPFGNIKNVGRCRFECWVRSDRLYTCRHCRRQVCQRHSLITGNRAYCRKWPCSMFGRIRQAKGISSTILRICFGPMMAKQKKMPEREIVPERDFFEETEEREDLSALERGDDEDER